MANRSNNRSMAVTVISSVITIASFALVYVFWSAYDGNLGMQLVLSGLAFSNAVFFAYCALTGDREAFFWSTFLP